jgi:hypothetical protein
MSEQEKEILKEILLAGLISPSLIVSPPELKYQILIPFLLPGSVTSFYLP